MLMVFINMLESVDHDRTKKGNGMNKRSIAISLQQHSYHAAKAFLQSGTLERYYTTVYNDGNLLYAVLERLLPSDLAKRTKKRSLEGLDPYVKKYCGFWGLLFLASGRVPILKNKVIQIRKIMNKRFAVKVAKDCIKRGAKLLLMYDTLAYDCFRIIKKKKSKAICVLDMSSTCSATIRRIIEEELNKNYSFDDSMKDKAERYSVDAVEMHLKEIQLADYFLSPSGFVSSSLIDVGVDECKIKYLPHGVDVNQFNPTKKDVASNRKLRFLFVGRVEAAKGIYYLVNAFNDERVKSTEVELQIVGSMITSEENLKPFDSNISYLGLKRRDEMPEVYANADVFILSSLWEGSSLSMLEAMASGLPVIASKYSCAPEVVDEFEEGFVVEPRNIDEMVEKILWFDSHRELIPQMSEKARKKIVENYTWEHYYNNLNKICDEILQVED